MGKKGFSFIGDSVKKDFDFMNDSVGEARKPLKGGAIHGGKKSKKSRKSKSKRR